MSLQEDVKKEEEQGRSLRERANNSQIKRKKELRAKLILMNAALALVVIMVLLVSKVVSLNHSQGDALEVSEHANAKAEQPEKDDEEEKQPEKTSKPTAEPEKSGASRWIRTDLDPDKPMVALTFDDGPYAPVTQKILATLKKNDGCATFFCVGNRIPNYTETVKQAYDQGCQIASHTYEHKILTQINKKQMLAQVKKTNDALKKVIGCGTTALRPPGGFVNDKVKSTIPVPMVCWNVDSEDWKSRNAKKVLKRCNSIQDGDIVLMHDLYPTTAQAVAQLVPRLRKKGFQLVTIDELFYYKGIKAEEGNVYYSGK